MTRPQKADQAAARLTHDEAAAYLGVSRSTMDRLKRNRLVGFYRAPGARRTTYSIEDLDEFAASRAEQHVSADA
jgi:excisionase family DNA binding protein